MRTALCSLLLVVFCALPSLEACAADVPADVTYVIPIKGQIERGLVYMIRRGLRQAEQEKAGAIVFDMDTPGGKLHSADEIVNTLLNISVPTYTFVNTHAISAGAIISFATDEIYMTPEGVIGDAMPILMSPLPFGGAQTPDEGIKEKIFSPTVALIRKAAQQKGHDENVGVAMVRPDFEYQIGDDLICPEGELLTLTSKEATRKVGPEKRALLAVGTVTSLDELLETIERKDNPVVVFEVSWSEKIARLIEGVPFSGILLALGLLGVYIEIRTPGFGFPGIGGILCLLIWFWGHHIAGLAGMEEILLFTAGIALLVVEVFVTPGFGFVGMTGLLLVIASVILSMVQHYPGAPVIDLPPLHLRDALVNLAVALVAVVGLGALVTLALPRTRLFHGLTLDTALKGARPDEAPSPPQDLVGARGVALTILRPAGIAELNGRRLNVVARGAFIEPDTPIVVAEVHGNRIVVHQA